MFIDTNKWSQNLPIKSYKKLSFKIRQCIRVRNFAALIEPLNNVLNKIILTTKAAHPRRLYGKNHDNPSGKKISHLGTFKKALNSTYTA
jgi:hypothetical protein